MSRLTMDNGIVLPPGEDGVPTDPGHCYDRVPRLLGAGVPSIAQRTLSRRQVLRGGLALAAGVAVLGPRRVLADALQERTRWAFLSDTHIDSDPDDRYRGFHPYRNLQEVTGQIGYDLPDGLVITGDLARLKGQTAAYQNLKTLLGPVIEKRPTYLGLGNHDMREHFLQIFADRADTPEAVENKHVTAANAGPVRLVVLDTLFHVNRLAGLLGWRQLAWLETFLQRCDDRPTILFLHHTPRTGLLDSSELFDIVGRTGKVKAVVYGHSHVCGFSQYQGVHLINLPATGYNLQGGEPVGWVEAKLTGRDGEFILHCVGGSTDLDGRTTKLRWRA